AGPALAETVDGRGRRPVEGALSRPAARDARRRLRVRQRAHARERVQAELSRRGGRAPGHGLLTPVGGDRCRGPVDPRLRDGARGVKSKRRGSVLAVVDLGSNAVRLQIAQVTPDGRAQVLAEDRAAVRLGEQVFRTGRLASAAIARTTVALERFAKLAERA